MRDERGRRVGPKRRWWRSGRRRRPGQRQRGGPRRWRSSRCWRSVHRGRRNRSGRAWRDRSDRARAGCEPLAGGRCGPRRRRGVLRTPRRRTGRRCSGGAGPVGLQTVPQEFVALVHGLLGAGRWIVACRGRTAGVIRDRHLRTRHLSIAQTPQARTPSRRRAGLVPPRRSPVTRTRWPRAVSLSRSARCCRPVIVAIGGPRIRRASQQTR